MGRLLRRFREWRGIGAFIFWFFLWLGSAATLACIGYFVLLKTEEALPPVVESTKTKDREKRKTEPGKLSQSVSDVDSQILALARNVTGKAELHLKKYLSSMGKDEEQSERVQLSIFLSLANILERLEKAAVTKETKKELRGMLHAFAGMMTPPREISASFTNDTTGPNIDHGDKLKDPP